MCQLGQRLDEKMPVLSVFCVYENNSLRAWFSLLYDKCNTNFSTNQIRVSFPCSRSRVAKHLTGFPLLLEFSLCPSGFAPGFPWLLECARAGPGARGSAGKGQAGPGHSEEPAGQWKVTALSCCRSCPAPRKCETCSAEPCAHGSVLFFQVLISFEDRREFRVIYHVSLLQEIWFNRPNLNLLLILLISCKYLCFNSVFSLKTMLFSGMIILHENDSKHDSVWEVMDKNRPIFIQSYSVFSPSLCIVPEPMHTAGQ